jgi:hypothetical protein
MSVSEPVSAPGKIVSGGQTGADRAALDWGMARGIPHGGWCPRGRKAEDGIIPACYRLEETRSAAYRKRTEWNVRDSGGTGIFTISPVLTGGSKKTAVLARKHGRPCLHIFAQAAGVTGATLLRDFVRQHGIRVLNVAGSRASKEPEIGAYVKLTIDGLRALKRSRRLWQTRNT